MKAFNFLLSLVAIFFLSETVQFVRSDECEAFDETTTENPEDFNPLPAAKEIVPSDFIQDKRSLLIVFDNTGSMSTDLEQLRAAAIEIVTDLSNRPESPIHNYVLSVFNDPHVEEPFVTTDPLELIAKLNAIRVHGGGDCPELALTGLQNAMDHALPNSLAFIFTDASAKDFTLFNVVSHTIQRRQIRVYILSTGYCDDRGSQEFKVLEKVARVSGGQLFNMESTDVKAVLLALTLALESNFVTLMAVDFEEAGSGSTILEVDESFEELMLSLSGIDVSLAVRDSRDNVVESLPGSFESRHIRIMNFERTDNRFTIEASSSAAYSIRVGGISALRFRFGFSTVPTVNMDETRTQPFQGRRNILTIFASEPSRVKCLSKTSLVPAMEASDGTSISLKRITRDVFATELFDIPEEAFRIQVHGFDPSGNVIDRVISTGIEIDKSIPSIPCHQDCGIQVDGIIPHLTNCRRFFQCIKGVTHVLTCPSSLLFDVVTFTCRDSEAALCFDAIPCVD